jgi:hypothetical protein
MQRTSSPRWLKPYWSGIASPRREREARHDWLLELAAAVEEVAELLSDLAAARLAFLPLVRVDAQGGVGFAVAEPPLHVDDGNVEGDQHACVAVAQVVKARLRRVRAGSRYAEFGGSGAAAAARIPETRAHDRIPLNAVLRQRRIRR